MINLLKIHAILLSILFSFNVFATSETLRCKGKIIRPGTSVVKLLKKCGMPEYVDSYLGKHFVQTRKMYYTSLSRTFIYIVEVRDSTIYHISRETH